MWANLVEDDGQTNIFLRVRLAKTFENIRQNGPGVRWRYLVTAFYFIFSHLASGVSDIAQSRPGMRRCR
jgi:hypothetical protein